MRSNYFYVKSIGAFINFCKLYNLEYQQIKEEDKTSNHDVVMANEPETGMVCFANEDFVPQGYFQGEKYIEVDFFNELGKLLEDNNVAIVMEISYEGLRWVNGFTVAVNNGGYSRQISLMDIYSIAEDMGDFTACEY